MNVNLSGGEKRRKEASPWDALLSFSFHENNTDKSNSVPSHSELSPLDEEELSEKLKSFPTPVDERGAGEVFDEIRYNKHLSRILSYMSGRGFHNYREIDPTDVVQYLEKYPTPIEFKNDEETFLDAIKAGNSPEKYLSYVQDMELFKDTIYGWRQEEYRMALKNNASFEKDLDMTMQITGVKRDAIKKARAREKMAEMASLATETSKLYYLEESESKELLEKTKIDGDPAFNGEKYEKLTPDFLEKHHLEPKYGLEFENVKIGFSREFDTGSRESVLAYVQSDSGTKLCGYYRSNSANQWRLLPDYVNNPSMGKIDYFGKGYGEESLTLPHEIQVALESARRQPHLDLSEDEANFALTGTARRLDGRKDEYLALRDGKIDNNDYYKEVIPTPALVFNHLSYEKDPPETLNLPSGLSPDFSTKAKDEYQTIDFKAGEITIDTFKSKEGELYYKFMHDQNKRAWLSGIEVKNSKITSSGLRKTWIEAGDFATPLYEYESVSSGYGDTSDTSGPYTCMWTKYLQHIPLIKEYLKTLEN